MKRHKYSKRFSREKTILFSLALVLLLNILSPSIYGFAENLLKNETKAEEKIDEGENNSLKDDPKEDSKMNESNKVEVINKLTKDKETGKGNKDKVTRYAYIPDANLRAGLNAALGQSPNANITRDQLSTLQTLDLRGRNIQDINGLEACNNLIWLSLDNNSISNIIPLSSLRMLKSISIRSNKVSDVRPVSRLHNLTYLGLDNNQISDISPLANLTTFNTLTTLKLSDQRITGPDVNAVGGIAEVNNIIKDTYGAFIPPVTSSDYDYVAGPKIRFKNITGTGNRSYRFNKSVTIGSARATFSGETTHRVAALLAHIPDANLKAALNNVLGQISRADISIAQLNSLTGILALNNKGIRDLTGIEHLKNINQLNLDGNDIRDLSPLSGLTNLNRLDLSNNHINNISPLSGLTNLFNLGLESNSIKDITSIRRLNKLLTLKLSNNQISDISPLAGLTKLDFLSLYANRISNSSPVSMLTNLTYLSLKSNSISDISPLSGLTKIKTLDLDNNSISDISPLARLTNLTTLKLLNQRIIGPEVNSVGGIAEVNNIIKDKDGSLIPPVASGGYDYVGNKIRFKNITSTENRSYRFNKSVTIGSARATFSGETTHRVVVSLLAHIPDANLKAALNNVLGQSSTADISIVQLNSLTGILALNNKGIRDLTGIEHLKNIEQLNLDGNDIRDLSPLSGLTNLNRLDLSNNQISDISPLSGLTNIGSLLLNNNQISDISPLSGFTNIGSLQLNNNQISDISLLSGFTNLFNLGLESNSIKDITSIRGLNKLLTLNLSSNQISDVSSLAGLNKLNYLFISYNNIGDISPIKNIIDTIQGNSGSFEGLGQVININSQYNLGSEYTLENIIIGKNGGKEAAINILPTGSYNSTTGEITWTGLSNSMNDLSYSWKNDADKFSGTVNVKIRQITDPSVLIEIPSKIKMEDLQDENAPDIDPTNRPGVKPTVYNMVGAKTPIKLVSDPSITLKGNLKIYTDPIFRVTSVSNSSDYVPVSVYKDFNSRLTNPKDPLMTLNSSNKEKNFIIKATKSEFKGSYGKYAGAINFTIDYSK